MQKFVVVKLKQEESENSFIVVSVLTVIVPVSWGNNIDICIYNKMCEFHHSCIRTVD